MKTNLFNFSHRAKDLTSAHQPQVLDGGRTIVEATHRGGTPLSLFLLILLTLTFGFGQSAWASEEFKQMWGTYNIGGDDTGGDLSSDKDLGNVSKFVLKDFYLKCHDNWGASKTAWKGGALYYKFTGDANYTEKVNTSTDWKPDGWSEADYQFKVLGWNKTFVENNSGNYSIKFYGKVWGDKGDTYKNNDGSNYTWTFTILPPTVSLGVSQEGAIRGAGTKSDPYIVLPGHDLTLTAKATPAHTDNNSSVYYTIDDGTESSSVKLKKINVTSDGSCTIKARSKNTTANIESDYDTKTIYYKPATFYLKYSNGTSQGSKVGQMLSVVADTYTCTWTSSTTNKVCFYVSLEEGNTTGEYENFLGSGTLTDGTANQLSLCQSDNFQHVQALNSPYSGGTYKFTFTISGGNYYLTCDFPYTGLSVSKNISAATSSSPSISAYSVVKGGSVTVTTAAANKGYYFQGWTSENGVFDSQEALSTSFTPNASNAIAIANYALQTYDVTLVAGDGGTDGSAKVQYTATALSSITHAIKGGYNLTGYFTAASKGNKIINADGTLVNTSISGWLNSGKWNKTENSTLYAQWEATTTTYSYTFGRCSSQSEAMGTVASSEAAGSVLSGKSITVTAIPKTGYEVEGWYSDQAGNNAIAGAGTTNPYVFNISANTSVYVKFQEKKYTVNVIGTNTGIASVSPASVSVGQITASESITATAATGYTLAAWTLGDGVTKVSGEKSPITIKATKASSITANATEDLYDVIVTNGTKTSGDKAGIATTVTLKANTATVGKRFTSWSATGTYSLVGCTLNDETITFNASSEVSFTANYVERFAMRGSKNDDSGTGGLPGWETPSPEAYFTQVGDAMVYTATLETDTRYKYKVYDYVRGKLCGATGDSDQPAGTEWTLKDGSGNQNAAHFTTTMAGVYTFTVAESSEKYPKITITYPVETKYTVSVSAAAHGQVNVSSVSGVGSYTKSSIITATPNTGYKFKNWTIPEGITIADGDANSASIKIHATAADKTITANFESDWYMYGSTAALGGWTTKWADGAFDTYGDVTVKKSFTLAANTTYEFKMYKASGEKHYWSNSSDVKDIQASVSNITLYDNNGNMSFKTTVAGTYTFAVELSNASAPKLSITYPTAYTVTFGYGTGGNSVTATVGGNEIASGDLVLANSSVTFTQTAATGYTFKEWNTKQDGSGTQLSSDASYAPTINAKTTVYAIYQPKTTTVHFNANGGNSSATFDKVVTYGTREAILSAEKVTSDLSRTGYNFNNYYIGETGSESANRMTNVANSGNLWFVDGNREGFLASGKWIGTMEETTFYARWTQKEYTVTLPGGGGDDDKDGSLKVKYDAANTVSGSFEAPTKLGYSLKSSTAFFADAEFTQPVFTTGGNLSTAAGNPYVTDGKWNYDGAPTIYTQWTPNAYPISFDDQESTTAHTFTITQATYDASMPAFASSQAPQKTGYTFQGYYTQTEGQGTKCYNSDGTSAYIWKLTPSESTTLYAYWTPNNYQVKFERNNSDGGADMENESFVYDAATKALTKNTYTRTGYTFNGWNTAANGSGTAYADEHEVQNLTAIADGIVPLYAQWNPTKTIVTIYKNAGEDVETTATMDAVYDAVMPQTTASGWTKTGYNLANFYLDRDYSTSNIITSTNTAYARNVVVAEVQYTSDNNTPVWKYTGATLDWYARWTAKTYEITFDSNGGTSQSFTKTFTYDAKPVVDAGIPTHATDNFAGYAIGSAEGTLLYNAAGKLIYPVQDYTDDSGKWINDGAITLYAKWISNYTIILDGDGATTPGTTSVDVNPNTTILTSIAEIPTKTGYTFGGYYTDKDGSGTQLISNQGTWIVPTDGYIDNEGKWIKGSNATLYAKWTINKTVITFDKQEGTGGTGQRTLTYNSTNFGDALVMPTRTGYIFGGYFTEVNGGGTQLVDENGAWIANVAGYTSNDNPIKWIKTTTDPMTLYAKWTPVVTNITIYRNDQGSAYQDEPTATLTATYDSDAFSTDASKWKRTGYTLNNFWLHRTEAYMGQRMSTNDIRFNKDGATYGGVVYIESRYVAERTRNEGFWKYAAGGDLNWYAHWNPDTTIVTLDNQGADAGKGGDATVTCIYDEAVPTLTAKPEKTGYSFGGYYTGTNGTGKIYINGSGSSAKPWTETEITTLYAKWIPNTNTPYTVNHYKQNVADDDYTLAETDNLTGTTATSVTPAVKSYTGFQAPATQTVEILASGLQVVTYQYTRNSYNLAWALDGGTAGTGIITSEGSTKFETILQYSENPTKTGYNFTAWSPEMISGTTTMPATEQTYTAQWTAKQYTVTLDNQDATTPGAASVTATYNTTVPSIAGNLPAKTGFAFDGYFTLADGGDQIIKSDGTSTYTWQFDENKTLYAHWTTIYAYLEGRTKIKNQDGTETVLNDKADWDLNLKTIPFTFNSTDGVYYLNTRLTTYDLASYIGGRATYIRVGTAIGASSAVTCYSAANASDYKLTSENKGHGVNTTNNSSFYFRDVEQDASTDFSRRGPVMYRFNPSTMYFDYCAPLLTLTYSGTTATMTGYKIALTNASAVADGIADDANKSITYQYKLGDGEWTTWTEDITAEAGTYKLRAIASGNNEFGQPVTGVISNEITVTVTTPAISAQVTHVNGNAGSIIRINDSFTIKHTVTGVPADQSVMVCYHWSKKPDGSAIEHDIFTQVDGAPSSVYTSIDVAGDYEIEISIANDVCQDSTETGYIKWQTYKLPIHVKGDEITVYAKLETSITDWNSKYVYYWRDASGTWPGYPMSYIGKDSLDYEWYSYNIANYKTFEGGKLLFNDGTTKYGLYQTTNVDMPVDDEFYYIKAAVSGDKRKVETYDHINVTRRVILSTDTLALYQFVTIEAAGQGVFFPTYEEMKYTYTVTDPDGNAVALDAKNQFIPSKAGNYTLTIKCDAGTYTATNTFTLRVQANPLTLTPSATGDNIAIGTSTTVTVSSTGTLPSGNRTYTVIEPGTNAPITFQSNTASNTSSSYTLLSSGTYTFAVVLTDNSGHITGKAQCNVTVQPKKYYIKHPFKNTTSVADGDWVWKEMTYNAIDGTYQYKGDNAYFHKDKKANINQTGTDEGGKPEYTIVNPDNLDDNTHCVFTYDVTTDKVTVYALNKRLYRIKSICAGNEYFSNAITQNGQDISFFAQKDGQLIWQERATAADDWVDQAVTVTTTASASGIYTATPDVKATSFALTAYTGTISVFTQLINKAGTGAGTATAAEGKMTEFTKEKQSEYYNHYWVRYVEANTQAMATMGNSINNCIAITLPYYEMPADGNVRYAYDNTTNHFSRTFLAGSGNKDFLRIYGQHLDTLVSGTTYNPINSLEHSKMFYDGSDWIYTVEASGEVSTSQSVTGVLVTKFNGTNRWILSESGLEADPTSERVVLNQDVASPGRYNLTAIYDYKTNRLTVGGQPEPGHVFEDTVLIDQLILTREGDADASYFNVMEKARLVVVDKMTVELIVDKTNDFVNKWGGSDGAYTVMYYWFSLPYQCRINEIYGLGVYGEKFEVQRYRGDLRAAGTAGGGQQASAWRKLKATATMEANRGYVIAIRVMGSDFKEANKQHKIRLFFPSTEKVELSHDAKTILAENENNATSPLHWNWNIMGNPLIANGKGIIDKTSEPDEAELNFIYVWDWAGGQKIYTPESYDDVALKSTHGYMVQAKGAVYWSYPAIKADPQSPARYLEAAQFASEDSYGKLNIRLNISQDEQLLDKTYILYREDGDRDEYEMGRDLEKIINSGVTQMYASPNNNLAAICLNSEDKNMIPLTVIANSDGNYTFSLHRQLNSDLEPTIYDAKTQQYTNLSMSNCNVVLTKGTYTNRFFFLLRKTGVITNMGELNSNNYQDGVQKIILNEQLYILRDGQVYRATGSLVK